MFIYHILTEGILIDGNNKEWENIKSKFKLKDNFNEEIEEILEISDIFLDIEIFGNQYLTMYSNLFTNIKNFAIFFLANIGIYMFDKEKAVKKVFGDYYFDLLIESYNYYERGIKNNKWNKWCYSCKKTALDVTTFYLSKMEELYSC